MKGKLEVRCETIDERTCTYVLTGNLHGGGDAYAFQDEVRDKITGKQRVIIDLTSVDRIDSSGIGILVALMWSASQSEGRMVLASLPDNIKKILDIAMLLDHIDNTPTVEAALELIG